MAIARISPLALHTAGTVGTVVGIAAAAGGAVAAGSLGAGLLLGLVLAAVATGVTYAAVRRRIASRLDLARVALRDARKRRFEALSQLPTSAADRDELDALVQQVARAGRALQVEIERLRQMESYRRDFLGDVSHELRTPIFAVSGFAETLLDGALDDDAVRVRFVEKILANANRLEMLTRDLSQISNLETGRLSLSLEPVSIAQVATEVVEGLDRLADERGIALAVLVADSVPHALADRARIQQVLTNLVENAIHYNEQGGRVEVVARAVVLPDGSPGVRTAVVDDGIGIPGSAIARLTERFYRVDKSRSRAQGGTGLGLAIVKHILEGHGQRLAIESQPGYGSTFAFSLPAAVPSEDGPDRP